MSKCVRGELVLKGEKLDIFIAGVLMIVFSFNAGNLQGSIPQMSLAYSLMVRSLLK